MPTPQQSHPPQIPAKPADPKIYALLSVLDYMRAMRTATSIRPSEAREFAVLEEEFEKRHLAAKTSHGTKPLYKD